MLEAIRPHLAQANRNTTERRALEERAEATERALWSSPAGDLALLTRREHEILVLVANGETNPQIADCLSLSPRTVQKQLEHIYEKLGVRTRTAAAMKLATTGR